VEVEVGAMVVVAVVAAAAGDLTGATMIEGVVITSMAIDAGTVRVGMMGHVERVDLGPTWMNHVAIVGDGMIVLTSAGIARAPPEMLHHAARAKNRVVMAAVHRQRRACLHQKHNRPLRKSKCG
jgi:hypothetical protein